eukprot:UN21346
MVWKLAFVMLHPPMLLQIFKIFGKLHFELSQCSETRTFDEIMNDQLFITNQMITELENDVDAIPDVNTQLQTAQSELDTIWANWQSEITATI